MFNEACYENAVIELLQGLGYEHRYGPDIERDYHNPLCVDVLSEQLPFINPKAKSPAIAEALHRITNIEQGTLLQKNKIFTDWLRNGLEVSYQEKSETKTEIINLVDFKNPQNNGFQVINQWTYIENAKHRPDLVIFVNGFPLVVAELKTCMNEDVGIENGYKQLRNYMKEIPGLFVYNAFCIISDLTETKAGTISSGFDRFAAWKTVDGDYEETKYAQYHVLFEGMLEQNRFLDLLQDFILFSHDMPEDIKILAAYHQYFAVKKAVLSTLKAAGFAEKPKTGTMPKSGKGDKNLLAAESVPQYSNGNGKGGVFWHTQGSGKSLSMVFYAALLNKAMESPTIVVLTDRNNLDDQLYEQFAACKDFLRQTPGQAESRKDLHDLLDGRQANGIFFTTIQKFEESSEPLSTRRNIVVMADEAHRSHYGLTEKVTKSGRVITGAARIIRDSLPNAVFIGFTGTPIASADKNTREVFGDYIDIYDMTQSVEDGATKPVYYESRVINLGLKEEVLKRIDETYAALALNADEKDIEKSKKELGSMEAILGAPETITSLCRDIIEHYEHNRAGLLSGKALVVCYSRPIAMSVYRKFLELRRGWHDKVKAVMTAGNNDPEDWHSIIGNKTYKKELAKKFKDDDDPLKIAVVVDMWLTGFDVPSLATMYVFKPMMGHNLMQAIARVNRVFKDKEGGLVVDYIGIAGALKQAMNDYTRRDQKNYGEMDIAKTALPKFAEKLQVCAELFHGFDWRSFIDDGVSDAERAKTIRDGINFILGKDEEAQKDFRKEALLLKQAKSLCQSLLTKEQRYGAAYFEAIRVALNKFIGTGKLSFREINSQIAELLKQCVRSEGVINLFGDTWEEFSIFSPKYLEEIAKMKEKNLAVELLRKLIDEQVTIFRRHDFVQGQKFSERMQKLINAYRNGQISNADVIEELRKMAHDISSAREEGVNLGLTPEELSFYHALSNPLRQRDYYTNEQLRAMTQELTETLRKNRTIDWNRKQGARAAMRMLVKRLLKKYKYPPEGEEEAINTVISQCETWVDEVDFQHSGL
ncbi:putative type I restriction enzyme, R subunit [Hollandina sp. SP2]